MAAAVSARLDNETPERTAGRAGGRAFPALSPELARRDIPDWLSWAIRGDGAEEAVRALEGALHHSALAPHATVVSRGRDGLRALLAVCARRHRREVIIPGYTDRSVYDTVRAAGYVPVLADIRLDDGNVDPNAIWAALGPRTAAVVVTHLYGHPADMDEIGALCASQRIPLLEDAAHALGATYAGRAVGRLGQGAFTSLAPFKVIQALGGGVVWSSNPRVAEGLRAHPACARCFPTVPGPIPVAAHVALTLLMRSILYDRVTHPLMGLAVKAELNPQTIYKQFVRPFLKSRSDAGAPFTAFQATLAMRQLQGVHARSARRREVADRIREELAQPGVCVEARPGRNSAELHLAIYAQAPGAAMRDAYRAGLGVIHSPMTNLFAVAGHTNHRSASRFAAEHALLLPLYHTLADDQVTRMISVLQALRHHWVAPDASPDRDRP